MKPIRIIKVYIYNLLKYFSATTNYAIKIEIDIIYIKLLKYQMKSIVLPQNFAESPTGSFQWAIFYPHEALN